MRRNGYIGIVAALLMALALLSASSAPVTPAVQSGSTRPARTVTVVGQGKASGTPDVGL